MKYNQIISELGFSKIHTTAITMISGVNKQLTPHHSLMSSFLPLLHALAMGSSFTVQLG
jgi:hypothetical protein